MSRAKSRFVQVDTAQHYPGIDFVTGSGKGPFIDTGFHFNRMDSKYFNQARNRVYLAVTTVKEMAEAAGLLDDQVEARQYSYDIGYADGYAAALKEHNNGDLASLLDGVRRLSDRLSTFLALDGPDEEDGGAVERGYDSVDESGSGHPSSGDERASDTARQELRNRRKQGPDGIPSGAGDDSDPFTV